MDKISVVIPAYNAEATIEQAVVSAAAQTWQDTEIIVVDDGSTDRTPETLEGLKERFPNLKVIRQENGGVSSARNTGIAAAAGRWLVTLDDDDYIDGEMLEKLHACGQEGCDLAICGMKLVYPDRTEAFSCGEGFTDTKENFLKRKMAALYDAHLLTTHSNKLYDIDIIRREGLRYDPALQINEDIDFVFRYLKHCGRIGCIPGNYLNYVQHGTGESMITTFRANGVSSAVKLTVALDTLLSDIADGKELAAEMHHRLLVHILSFAGLMYYRSSMSDEEKLAVIRSLAADPVFVKLLTETKPKDLKTAVAKHLLGAGQCKTYHKLCKAFYRPQGKR